MKKFDYKAFLDDLLSQIKSLAANEWSDYKTAAIKDGTGFIKQTSADIQRWTAQVANKEITEDDLQYLVKGKMDVAELHALTQAGLAQVRAEKFRDAVVGLIVNSVFKAVGKIV